MHGWFYRGVDFLWREFSLGVEAGHAGCSGLLVQCEWQCFLAVFSLKILGVFYQIVMLCFIQMLQHKCCSGVIVFIEIFRLNLCFFSTYVLRNSVEKFKEIVSYFQVLKLLSWVGKFVSINVICLRVFSYPKIGPKVLSFSCIFFRLGKNWAWHTAG